MHSWVWGPWQWSALVTTLDLETARSYSILWSSTDQYRELQWSSLQPQCFIIICITLLAQVRRNNYSNIIKWSLKRIKLRCGQSLMKICIMRNIRPSVFEAGYLCLSCSHSDHCFFFNCPPTSWRCNTKSVTSIVQKCCCACVAFHFPWQQQQSNTDKGCNYKIRAAAVSLFCIFLKAHVCDVSVNGFLFRCVLTLWQTGDLWGYRSWYKNDLLIPIIERVYSILRRIFLLKITGTHSKITSCLCLFSGHLLRLKW